MAASENEFERKVPSEGASTVSVPTEPANVNDEKAKYWEFKQIRFLLLGNEGILMLFCAS